MKTNLKVNVWGVVGTAVVALLIGVTDARAVSFKLMGAGNLLSKEITALNPAITVDSSKGKFAFGGGASVVFGGPVFGVEVGVSYLTSEGTTMLSQSGVTVDISPKWSYVQIPLLARMNLGRVVSLGLGGYYNKAVGKLVTTSQGTTVEGSFDDALASGLPMKSSSYGALASLAFDIPLGASAGLVIDGRYALGLADVSLDSSVNGYSWKPSDIQAYVGIRLGGSR